MVLGPAEFRELASGRRRGLGATLTRAALRTLEVPYTAAMRVRNWRYDTGRATIHHAAVPVISVGNITLGGTGKTPTVEWLARWFRERGVRPGLVSRGYGSSDGSPNDEALELAEQLPDVPHVLDRERARGAQRAIREFGCQLIILDDGFQHRRLARDFDLVLVDALDPFGHEHVFPRGTLREPLSGWARADALMLTRCEQVDAARREQIRRRAAAIHPQALWLEAMHAPQALRTIAGTEQSLDSLAGQRVAAFCGIGNPSGFAAALRSCGYELATFQEFPDHFAYPAGDVAALIQTTDAADIAAVLCTHKDLVKIGSRWTGTKPLLALSSRLQIQRGQTELETRLAQLAARALHDTNPRR